MQGGRKTDAPVTRREILGWCMYDVADSSFTTVIVTTAFAMYFARVVVGDESRADLLWGWAASISELAVGLVAPVLGAVADYSGSRKKFLGACAAAIILFTASLWFAQPGTVVLALLLYVAANVGFAGGGVFIDSFLPGISTPANAGRISGLKWAMGYASGLMSLALCLPLAQHIKANPTPQDLAYARLVPVLVAAYYAVAVVPTFLFLRERSRPAPLPPGLNYVTAGYVRLRQTLRHIRRYRELVKLLIAFLIYNDGIVTVIYFAARYATDEVQFTETDTIRLFIALNVVAVAGAFFFGWLADLIGQKRTIMISLLIWMAAVVAAYSSHSKMAFYVAAGLAGLGMGSCQSVTRSLVALFTPKDNAAEFYGFLGIAGKALAFLGPIVFGTISALTGSKRPAILVIGTFFLVGMAVLSTVDERRGREASRIPVGAGS
jgi:UMF1 family MFS transporter